MIRDGTPDDFAVLHAFDSSGGDRREELAGGRVLVAKDGGRVAGG